MAVFTKRVLSGSSGGRPIAIGTGLTVIHSSVSGASDWDEVFFYVHNLASVAKTVTAYFGATSTSDKLTKSVPPRNGLYLIGPGAPMGLGKIVKALATGGGTNLTAHGWANRIVQ